MNKLFYPAIFEPDEDGSFSIEFPDIDGAVTGGDSLEAAYQMAFDCLGLILSHMTDSNEFIPPPSSPQDLKLEEGQFLVVIEFDMAAYKRKTSSRAVKKTLSIPEWLNEEATQKGINFSAVLQEALKQQLNL